MGRHEQPVSGEERTSRRQEVQLPEYDWQDIDWLEETPPRRSGARQESQQQPEPYAQQPRRQAPRQQPDPYARQPRRQAPRQQPDPYAQQPRRQASRQQAEPYAQQPRRQTPRQQPDPYARQPRRQSRPAPVRAQRYEDYEDPAGYDGRYEPRQVAVEPEGYRHKRRGMQKQSIPLILLIVVLVGGVVFAGGKLGSILLNYHRDRSAYESLADEALAGLAEPDVTASPDATPEPGTEQVQSEVPISVNWEYLQSRNADIVGWLYCANTPINYPVMQTGDNDYYLHRGFDRQTNTAGSLFVDYNATDGIPYSNYIVYGHNMKDGSMFATAYDYVTQDFYNQHPVMYFLTPETNYRIELIAAHIVESTLDNYPGYFEGDGDYMSYLNDITSRSFFRTNWQVSTEYQLMTMSTCDYSSNYNDPRFLLHGQMVPVQ